MKFTDVCMTGGMHYTPSHTNVCITSVNFDLFEFLAAILEKGLLLLLPVSITPAVEVARVGKGSVLS